MLEASRSSCHYPRLPVFSIWLKGLFSRFLVLLQGGGTLPGSVSEAGSSRVRRNWTARLTCSFQHSVISLLGNSLMVSSGSQAACRLGLNNLLWSNLLGERNIWLFRRNTSAVKCEAQILHSYLVALLSWKDNGNGLRGGHVFTGLPAIQYSFIFLKWRICFVVPSP